VISPTLADRLARAANRLARFTVQGDAEAAGRELERIEIIVREMREQREVDYHDAQLTKRVTTELGTRFWERGT